MTTPSLAPRFGRPCATPGCNNPPTHQWQRAGTDDEAAQFTKAINDEQRLSVESRRHTYRQHLRQLQGMLDDPQLPADLRPRLEHNIAGATSDLADIAEPPPVPARPVRVALFACDDHKPAEDKLAHVHEAHCMTDGTCTCATTPAT